MSNILFKIDNEKILFVVHSKMANKLKSNTTTEKKFAWKITEDEDISSFISDGFTLADESTDFSQFRTKQNKANNTSVKIYFLLFHTITLFN